MASRMTVSSMLLLRVSPEGGVHRADTIFILINAQSLINALSLSIGKVRGVTKCHKNSFRTLNFCISAHILSEEHHFSVLVNCGGPWAFIRVITIFL